MRTVHTGTVQLNPHILPVSAASGGLLRQCHTLGGIFMEPPEVKELKPERQREKGERERDREAVSDARGALRLPPPNTLLFPS